MRIALTLVSVAHAHVASSVVAEAEAEAEAVAVAVAVAVAEMIRLQTTEMFVHLMDDGMLSDVHRHTADVMTDVWTSEVLAPVQGCRTVPAMRRRFVTAIDLIARAQGGEFVTST